ncbi:16600_t:CDS:1, partial [Acaulospora colombiana]
MLPLKRKRSNMAEKSSSEEYSSEDNSSEGAMLQDEELDDQEEMEMIQQSIAKRNMREGTELLKKTSNIKGKGKAKNEVGSKITVDNTLDERLKLLEEK